MLQLRNAGVPAFRLLEQLSRRHDADISHRATDWEFSALDLCRHHFESHAAKDPTLRNEARQSLQRMIDDPSHHLSRRAKKIVESSGGAASDDDLDAAGGVKELSTPIQFGGKEFRFIKDRSGIMVLRPDGEGGIRRSAYEDAKELKSVDPDIHQIYDRFFDRLHGLPIRVGKKATADSQEQPQ